MKVVTIGRSSENDIAINDPKVSRHHCQIVQFDNGTFGIVDFDSTNGTFVNGQRVHGQVALKQGDRVQVVENEVPWQQYFPAASKKRTNWWLWPTVAGAVAVMVLAVVLVLWLTGIIGVKEILYDGPEPTIATVTLEENGVSYDVEAAEGQVIVIFEESVSHRKAVKILKNNNATIVAQIPDVQYYLVEVPAGKEAQFFSQLKKYPEIDYVYPNIIDEVCSVEPYVLDNFSCSDHGKRVMDMMGNSTLDFVKIDLGIDKRHVSGDEQALILSLANLRDDGSAVLNMSFGPSRSKNVFRKQEEIMKSYRKAYIEELKGYVDIAKRFDDKDFVIVKSTGNQGVKNLEDGIDELINLLDSEERAVFERHFILVSAKDDNKFTNMAGDYPNDVSLGKYNKMVTKVDISDMTAQDAHWSGTSFSSPRAAGFITTVANSNNMKVTDVLEYVRKATKKAPDHILTQELLEKVIEEETKKDNSESEYKSYGCLKYRLIKNNELEDERLELRNTCDEDIRVTGYLLNTIAPHGGENTIDFETIIRADRTEYVDGFLENECTIKSVEKVATKPTKHTSSAGSTSRQGVPAGLVGTRWGYSRGGKILEFVDQYHIKFTIKQYGHDDDVFIKECYYDSKNNHVVVIFEYGHINVHEEVRFECRNGRLTQVDYINGGYQHVDMCYYGKIK